MRDLLPDLIKTKKQIEIMREGGQILSTILNEIKELIKPDIEVMELEKHFINRCKDFNVVPSCKDYSDYGLPPFPTGLCVSINSQAVHCFPKDGVKIKEGDIITVDTVIKYKNLHVDSAFASCIGNVSEEKRNLVKTSEMVLNEATKLVRDGVKIGELSNLMESIAKKNNCNVLKDYAGHGIGLDMHEWPEISCSGRKKDGPRLIEGMTICIEALVCSGSDCVKNVSAWETQMCDGKYFAQFEHTILVKKDGFEVLTK